MEISDLALQATEGGTKISARCGGHTVWYKFPAELTPELRGDAFLAASLTAAMSVREDIDIAPNISVSPLLIKNLEKVMEYYSSWEKYIGRKLYPVQIRGGIREPATSGVGLTTSYFSGGADGSFTFLKNSDEIEALLFAKGIDIQLSNDELFEEAFRKNQAYLERANKRLYRVETNVRSLCHHYGLSWLVGEGGGLHSIALAAGVKRCFVAASYSYHNFAVSPSSVITDVLFSNEYTTFEHCGADTTRIGKIATVARDAELLNILRVCWHDRAYNCGTCEKCLRTMAAIRILAIEAKTFPLLTDDLIQTRFSNVKVYSEKEILFYEELLQASLEKNDRVLSMALERIIKDFNKRKALRTLDEYYLKGTIHKLTRIRK